MGTRLRFASRITRWPREGYALLTAMIFALVITLAGLAFFSIATYETRSSINAHRSQQAFHIADGAIERARAMLLDDITWQAGWTAEALGQGEFDLTVTPTTHLGQPALNMVAEGRIANAARSIEAVVRATPSAFGLNVLVAGDADVNGNLCLTGAVHVGGDGDFGPGDVHLACGEYTEGFEVSPPPVRTEAGQYPDATYYEVRGTKIGNQYQARIFDGNGVDITSALGDSLVGVTSYHNGSKSFTFDFGNNAIIRNYFDESTGIFRRAPGDLGVVVNFGSPPVTDPPGILGVSNVILDGNASTTVTSTLINTRFTGITAEQRLDAAFWQGGLTTVKQITFEPSMGIALITKEFMKSGGSQVDIGTSDYPALVYTTGDVVSLNSNFELSGSLICLGDWNSSGGPNLFFDPSFQANLPGYLASSWNAGVSGTMHILSWREIASAGN